MLAAIVVTERQSKMNSLIDARQSYNDFYISNVIIDVLDGGLDKVLVSLSSDNQLTFKLFDFTQWCKWQMMFSNIQSVVDPKSRLGMMLEQMETDFAHLFSNGTSNTVDKLRNSLINERNYLKQTYPNLKYQTIVKDVIMDPDTQYEIGLMLIMPGKKVEFEIVADFDENNGQKLATVYACPYMC